MVRILTFILALFTIAPSFGQEAPKLVVGIVVDQMRMDYIYRYQHRFGEGGFKRIMNGGYTFHNAHFNYIPTATGPGHTSIYTGTTPGVHGVIGNSWYDKRIKDYVYCASDTSVTTIGADDESGMMSPHRMLTTTFTDELRLARPSSKVVGISIKDRGAIFPAGHLGKAFWYDSKEGIFISSSFYFDEKLPKWLNQFNRKEYPENYMKKSWEPLYPLETYTASGPDESPYEVGLLGKKTLPYEFGEAEGKKLELLPSTPFGNDLIIELAKAAVEGELLGEDDTTDVLAVSFSSTDYIGHNFGPNSVEVEDTYLRLDKNLEDLLNYLDQQVGEGAYTVFLTSDHGVSRVPQELMDQNAPGGYYRTNLYNRLKAYLDQRVGADDWIENMAGGQVFFNHATLTKNKMNPQELEAIVAEFLNQIGAVYYVYTRTDLIRSDFNEGGIKGLMVRGFNHSASGDVMFVLKPGWLTSISNYGTSHGSPYRYDTHVPVLFYGHSIRKGSSTTERYVTDIAPTMAYLLWLTMPSGSTGSILGEVVER